MHHSVVKNAFAVLIGLGLLASCSNPTSSGSTTTPTATSTVVYATGFGKDSSGNRIPGYWRNGVWHELPRVDSTKEGAATAIIAHKGIVYVCGTSNLSSNIPGYWKDGVWNALPLPTGSSMGGVLAIFFDGDDFYISGSSLSSTAIPGYWKNGTTWVALPPVYSAYGTSASGIIVSNGKVIASGYGMTSSGGDNPCYWIDGTIQLCTVVDSTTQDYTAFWSSLTVSGSDIYEAGNYQVGACFHPCYWKNGTPVVLPELDSTKGGKASAVQVVGSDVYCAGTLYNSSSVAVPGYWLNSVWHDLTPLNTKSYSQVNAMQVFDGSVYIGGGSHNSAGIEVPGYWKDGTWVGLPSADATQNSEVYGLYVTKE